MFLQSSFRSFFTRPFFFFRALPRLVLHITIATSVTLKRYTAVSLPLTSCTSSSRTLKAHSKSTPGALSFLIYFLLLPPPLSNLGVIIHLALFLLLLPQTMLLRFLFFDLLRRCVLVPYPYIGVSDQPATLSGHVFLIASLPFYVQKTTMVRLVQSATVVSLNRCCLSLGFTSDNRTYRKHYVLKKDAVPSM